ncbi:MAG: MMPL family transporter [Pseudomonadota bacterium]
MPVRDKVGVTYNRCLQQPVLILVLLGLLSALSISQLPNVRFDASADSLIAQGDPELAFYDRIVETFGQRSFLVLTYSPKGGDLFRPDQLDRLGELTTALAGIPDVESVQSLLDAPLLRSPPMPITELASGYKTLLSGGVDLALAREELTSSPLFRDLLISPDGQTTAIQINLKPDTTLSALEEQLKRPDLGEAERLEIEQAVTQQTLVARERQQSAIDAVRQIREQHEGHALMYLGGVPMVAADMIRMVREDMLLFATGIVLLLIAALYTFFRRLRWVFIPIGTSAMAILFMLGLLGAVGQPITAVSANFIALMAIITISFTIHLITRYRELFEEYKDDPAPCALAFETMRSKLAPCLYTALTTMVAFASLVTSNIVPVMDFGWIMCAGIVVSLFVTYSFFASVLVLLPKTERLATSTRAPWLTRWFAYHATNNPGIVSLTSVGILVVAAFGLSQLTLGNRLVEYFRADTEIRQGLDHIDRQLGGTIPLDIIVRFPPYVPESVTGTDGSDDFDDFDDFDEFAEVDGESQPDGFPERFWFTPEKIAVVDRIQQYLDEHPAFGKSVSVANLERLGRTFNDDEPLTYLMLTAILDQVPASARTGFVMPYADPVSGQLRISVRLHETGPVYDLHELIEGIERHAVDEVDVAPEDIHVTGVAVLFNDMLAQLVDSQVSSLSFVVGATFLMFALLLRSWYLALVGLLPNLLAASIILAFMGFAGIPLDLMTITIAAIIIGIGVDDAIHYLHRYRDERYAGRNSISAVRRTHASVGSALYFTSLTVVIGFSVLLASRFVPTVYFGALAALAMVLALTANLSLLPSILVKTDRRDFGVAP